MTDVLKMPKTTKRLPYWPEKLIAEGKVHGGKTYLARRIFSLAPNKYDWYLDAYGGAGSMTYNAPAGLESQMFNEKNYFRWLTKWVIQNRHQELLTALKEVQYKEETFLEAKDRNETDILAFKADCLSTFEVHRVETVVPFIIRNRMSRGGLGESFAWSDRLRGGQPGDLNAWCTMLERLPAMHNRLKDVILYNQLAEDLIPVVAEKAGKMKKLLFLYLDPPYLKSTRSTKALEYGDDEMTAEQHEQMLDMILRYPNVCFAISTYNNDLYESKLKNWRREDFSMPNHAGQGETKERRYEILYMNYVP